MIIHPLKVLFMKKLALLILLFAVVTAYSQNYKQVRIQLNDPARDIATLNLAGISIGEGIVGKDKSITVFLPDVEFNRLTLLPYQVTVLIDDWYKEYAARPQMTDADKQNSIAESKRLHNVEGLGYGSMGGYYTMNEVYQRLDSMRLLYPNLITAKYIIGYSVENRPIYAVKISDNPDQNEPEPEVLYTGLTHAREPAGMTAVMYYMYYLLENYATNPSVKYLVDNRQIYFVLVVNPDGYEYNRTTNPSGGGMWRKNRKNNGGSYGIDLNRNFGPYAYWDGPLGGSSTDPSSDTYRGTAPFSEPETQVLRDFVYGKRIKTALNYHTYSNLLVYPYGALARNTPDSTVFLEFAQDMTAWNGYEYGRADELLYPVRGGADDFMYDGDTVNNGKIIAMTPECGSSSDGFWPPQNRIFPIAIENLQPNIYLSWVAGGYVKPTSYAFNKQYFNAGDTVKVSAGLKNKGLSTATQLTVSMTSLSPFATILNGSMVYDSVQARAQVMTPADLVLRIAPNAPVETSIKLAVTVKTGNVVMSNDTLELIVGIPTFAFLDSANTVTQHWTVTSNPLNPKWETTGSSYHTAPFSFSDSPTGNYVANATVTLTSTNNINLTQYQQPKLSFWTKYDIESDWDAGFVQISTNNGSTWTNLSMPNSVAASGNGKQTPAGAPVYEGVLSAWTKQEVSLTPYAGQNVKLRFELRTDGSIHKQGWELDDIGIYVYTVVPVELTSFTSSLNNGTVSLQWSTATELNNKGFVVERSINGVSWESAGFVEGRGTTSESVTYRYTEKATVIGTIYYRLKQTDFDGTYRVYGPVSVENTVPVEYALEQNYPNPFNPSTVITFSLPKEEQVRLSVLNTLGEEVDVVTNQRFQAGVHQLNYQPQQLAAGVYFYKVQAGSFTQIKKMMLLK